MTSKARKAEPLTEARKAYSRTATRAKIASAIWRLWKKISQEQGLDQQWLADRMGTDKARVSRLLKAPGNWTIDTVADLLEAMESRLTDFEIVRYSELLGTGRSARAGPAPQSLSHSPVGEDEGRMRVVIPGAVRIYIPSPDPDSDDDFREFTTHSAARRVAVEVRR